MTHEQALQVAKADCYSGICFAIEKLEELGFDCDYYWETMSQVDDVDEDNLNIDTRNKLYEKLGIVDIMQRAYEEID